MHSTAASHYTHSYEVNDFAFHLSPCLFNTNLGW